MPCYIIVLCILYSSAKKFMNGMLHDDHFKITISFDGYVDTANVWPVGDNKGEIRIQARDYKTFHAQLN